MRKLYCTSYFPYTSKKPFIYRNKVLLGIGGNLGDCIKRFCALFKQIQSHPRLSILSTSPIYRNPPFGYTEQNDFYNATIELSTNLSLIELFSIVFYWERRWGRLRKREFKNAPRTLDIDILWFNQAKIKRPYLTIPHPYWQERESVLVPLSLQNIV
ncbi:2-amino-4-hydroxy-6-hydroxymethyldihydropteridine diphosphokinase [Helicobacter cholecystus]|uniref:2-amino-4-hydroxy-6-hydroxymethyldihydropteridine pyrophosphokinase n=1 Tax=Helicobacter cholecystus TaxID=45498 RepID=A0A3D8IV69_9HELI|nr:2-amino-4-hydroxy-6-hydroxymethyldihydropteridine diphosphokinase [Helicobacter cholecystus]RDU68903.1 2-amino-4-hydroxy-6-hydroxymethyldihydropteridine diphosphokinase [Helicobacter cholecystus]VEJ25859.1 2-amino-4-hydroxy-6-hydroxymethyldihydropteridinepyrophosphokinase [Helicobacter cholecystus]